MNFWQKFNIRWDDKHLAEFGTWFRMAYLLLPLAISYLVSDLTEVILWALINEAAKLAPDNILYFLSCHTASIKGIVYSIGVIFSVIVLREVAKNEITYDIEGENARNLSILEMFKIIFITITCAVIINYLFNYIGFAGSSSSYNEVYESQFGVDFAIGLILYGVISPFYEEILFRGILYNRLKRMFPLILSMILSAALFGMFHGNVVQGVYGGMMGMLIVYFYEKYGTIKAPICAHIAANLSIYILNFTLWK